MKRSGLLLIVLFVTLGAFAQDGKRGPYLTNKFFDNWFISAGGGVGVYWGEDDVQGDFGKRVAPAFDISLGKWVTPTVGVRLQFGGLQAKGFSYGDSPYQYGVKDAEGLYRTKFDLFNLHGDVMFDIVTAIGGYKEDRVYTLVPFVGVGWAHASKDGGHYRDAISGNVGLLNRFRLSSAWDLNLELRAMFVHQSMDAVMRSYPEMEANTNASIGFTYKFKKRGFDRPAPVVEPDYSAYNRRISALESDLSDAQNKARELADALARERAKPAVKEVNASPLAIFFTIGKANLSKKELINLGYLAETIKQSPDKKFKLQGSADEQTGSSKYNQKLSEKRAQAVYDALVNKYGVNGDQLIIDAIGGQKNNPYDEPYLNRVVLIKQ